MILLEDEIVVSPYFLFVMRGAFLAGPRIHVWDPSIPIVDHCSLRQVIGAAAAGMEKNRLLDLKLTPSKERERR